MIALVAVNPDAGEQAFRDHPRLGADMGDGFRARRDGVQRLVEKPQPLLEMLLADRRDRQMLHHRRSEEHTSELQSLMRISYAVFCLKKKKHMRIINL